MSLPWKYGRQLVSEEAFHDSQNMQFVIDHDVVPSRVEHPHVIQHLLFVDIDQHSPFDGFPQPGTLNFARLKDHVAVRQNDGRAPFPKIFDRVQ